MTEPAPGALMAAEIAEQPQVWRRILSDAAPAIAATAAATARRPPRFVLFTARGTSDHVALYGKYLIEIEHGLPAGLVSPSSMTVYGAQPDLRDVLVIAISQSGGSPDLVKSIEVARAGGAMTVALTNAADSALAQAAHEHIDILAGPEQSVAATKSYTAQLLVMYLLLNQVRTLTQTSTQASKAATDSLERLPDLGDQVLAMESQIVSVAQRYRFAQALVVTARGYSYPTAREAALKLMETSYLSAQAFSGADLLHGPLAMIDVQVPVLAVAPAGRGGRAMTTVLQTLAGRNADVFCVGTQQAVSASTAGLILPDKVAEPLSPLLEILPFQHLALHLTLARGGDPDTPRGLNKVTQTL